MTSIILVTRRILVGVIVVSKTHVGHIGGDQAVNSFEIWDTSRSHSELSTTFSCRNTAEKGQGQNRTTRRHNRMGSVREGKER